VVLAEGELPPNIGWCQRGRKLIGKNIVNLIVSWCGGVLHWCSFFWFKPEQHKKWVFVLEPAKREKVVFAGPSQDIGQVSHQTLAIGQKIKF